MKNLPPKLRAVVSNTMVQLAAVVVIAGLISFGLAAKLSSKKALVSAKSCQGLCVSITKDGMKPDSLSVKVGEYVQFNSADGQQHNFGLGAGEDDTDHQAHAAAHEHIGDFTSGDFNADEAWRVQFKTVGTYKFHDHYNPKLNILVVVYDPAGTKKIQ